VPAAERLKAFLRSKSEAEREEIAQQWVAKSLSHYGPALEAGFKEVELDEQQQALATLGAMSDEDLLTALFSSGRTVGLSCAPNGEHGEFRDLNKARRWAKKHWVDLRHPLGWVRMRSYGVSEPDGRYSGWSYDFIGSRDVLSEIAQKVAKKPPLLSIVLPDRITEVHSFIDRPTIAEMHEMGGDA